MVVLFHSGPSGAQKARALIFSPTPLLQIHWVGQGEAQEQGEATSDWGWEHSILHQKCNFDSDNLNHDSSEDPRGDQQRNEGNSRLMSIVLLKQVSPFRRCQPCFQYSAPSTCQPLQRPSSGSGVTGTQVAAEQSSVATQVDSAFIRSWGMPASIVEISNDPSNYASHSRI
jgi:hypothetical protein